MCEWTSLRQSAMNDRTDLKSYDMQTRMAELQDSLGRVVVDHPALEPVTDLHGLVATYVTPAHQHPLGRVLPGPERIALLDAAAAAGTVIEAIVRVPRVLIP